MESREVLGALVAVVTTLGGLTVTVAAPDEDMVRAVSPKSLRAALRKFNWTLHCTLNHCVVTFLEHRSVNSLGQHYVTPLGQALDAFRHNPGVFLADLRAAASAWRESVAALMESWSQLAGEAAELLDGWGDAATRSGQRPDEPQGLLRRLVAVCDKATMFPWELLRRLGDIEAILVETREEFPHVPEALVASVAEAERLWEASARLTTCHLLGTLGDIHRLLVSSAGGHGRHGVFDQCRRAMEDIPRLLGGSDVSNVTSSGQ